MTSNTKETASLLLKTSDITTDDISEENLALGINNSVGQITNKGYTIKWKNINPQLLLGDMYNKYERFNLNLASYSSRRTAASLSDSEMTYYISGLPWSNQSYSLKSGSITSKAPLFSLCLVNTTASGTDSFGQNMNTLTFNKPISNFDITIDMRNSIDTTPNQIMNHQTFIFDIVGVDGYQRNDIINNQELPRNNIDNRLQLNSFR
jgi:hypothetical protein